MAFFHKTNFFFFKYDFLKLTLLSLYCPAAPEIEESDPSIITLKWEI